MIADCNFVQNGCQPITETFFQPQLSGFGGHQSGPRSCRWLDKWRVSHAAVVLLS